MSKQQGKFISIHAPTRGATMWHWRALEECFNFNPRSHKGSDAAHRIKAVRYAISIHAPTRGATGYSGSYVPFGENFNPRSHKGSDGPYLWSQPGLRKISIHAPTRGATLSISDVLELYDISIHAPTRGATWQPRSEL